MFVFIVRHISTIIPAFTKSPALQVLQEASDTTPTTLLKYEIDQVRAHPIGPLCS